MNKRQILRKESSKFSAIEVDGGGLEGRGGGGGKEV